MPSINSFLLLPANVSSLVITVLNPLTPMAFLPPDLAAQLTMEIYITIASVAIQIWDVITHLPDDYILVRKYRIKFPTVVYFISRWTTIAYLVLVLITNSAPLGSRCDFVKKLQTVIYILAFPSSQLLFYVHVRAVYIDNKPIVACLTLMWIASVGSSVAPLIAASTVAKSINLGPTRYCIDPPQDPKYLMVSAIVPAVNDTLIFTALAWRILRVSCADIGIYGNFKTIIFAQYLPRFSKSFLQHGQAYILSITVTNIVSVVLISTPSFPIVYGAFSAYPGLMIINVLVTHLYRHTKSGTITLPSQSSQSHVPPSALHFKRTQISASQVVDISSQGTIHPIGE
ncbi:hypothetical protein BDN70DRAFT_934898 [Pholiota conissans]|uniref:DUF6533 domain-containing protein n=1 Tax=Pholiota conissans TaxID=109636 RepID=A0A9P5YVM9_9AGAR|nr:hypothetical protein BDN70DRAFT_934898 [Pholiota conissans]